MCEKERIKIIKNKVRYNIPRVVFECQNCGLNYLKPEEKDLGRYYTEDYRKKYSCIIGKQIKSKDNFNLLLPFQKGRLNQIKYLFNSKMNVLDVGSSTGHFLYSIKNLVKECIGIEYNIQEAEFCNKELGIKTYTTSIENTDIPLESFDIITIYQVLEHTSDPINFLKNYGKYLKKDGYIVIEVPNINDILISGYKVKSYIDFWYREPHLFNFSLSTLKLILEKSGFKGEFKGFQSYNFLNHLNWILTGKPQDSVKIGWSIPKLIKNNEIDEKIKGDINNMFKKVNEDYIKLLERHMVSESILFIGQKL